MLPIRGTLDLLPRELARRSAVSTALATVVESFGYRHAETPMLEPAWLFERTLGDASDVVSKEMFHVARRADDAADADVVLRPEGTAGMMRALFAQGVLPFGGPHLVYYCGPQFRYERPQRGRLRQFTQFGVECVNRASLPAVDAEVIYMAREALARCGLGHGLKLEINSLGCSESRRAYQVLLTAHLAKFSLSADSQARVKSGKALRVLDSKDALDREAIATAPRLTDSLTSGAASRFARVLEELENLEVAYEVNARLVRGLDYYNDTCFEFTLAGAQATTVLAGGRYDVLAQAMGAAKGAVPSIGWAAGLERIVLATAASSTERDADLVLVVPVLSKATDADAIKARAHAACTHARRQGLKAVLCWEAAAEPAHAVKKALQLADKLGCALAAFVGADEPDGACSFKHLVTGAKGVVAVSDLKRVVVVDKHHGE